MKRGAGTDRSGPAWPSIIPVIPVIPVEAIKPIEPVIKPIEPIHEEKVLIVLSFEPSKERVEIITNEEIIANCEVPVKERLRIQPFQLLYFFRIIDFDPLVTCSRIQAGCKYKCETGR
jgi:hypothetical protein